MGWNYRSFVLRAAVGAVVAAVGAGCTPQSRPKDAGLAAPENHPHPAALDPRSPALVNGVEISGAELQRRFELRRRGAAPGGDDAAAAARVKQQILRDLIDETLVRQAAAERKLEATAAEIEQAIRDFGATFPSAASFQNFLAGAEGAELRRKKELEILIDKLAGPAPQTTAEDVQKFYERNRRRFVRPEHLRASEIVFVAGPGATVAQRAAELRALRTEIAQNKISFRSAARKHSETPSKRVGGDLGEVTADRVPAPIWAALDRARPGTMTDVLILADRAVLLELRRREPALNRPLAAAEEEIRAAIVQQRRGSRRASVLDGLRARAQIVDRWTPRYAALFGEPRAGLGAPPEQPAPRGDAQARPLRH